MIRMAVIGCGGMSRNHVGQFNRLEGRATMVATADTDLEKAKAAAEHFEGAKTVADYHDILDEVDAVSLVLPHHLHHPVAMDCLNAGKHVLVEKPMANSEQECLEMIEAAEKKGLILMVAYCQRFNPLVLKVKELIDERAYGDIFQVSIWTEQHTQFGPDHWASSAATLGGGQLFSHGCHYIDLLLWFLGKPVRGTHLGTNYGTPWMEKEGTSNISMEFEGGPLGYHFGTWGAKGSRLRYSIHAHCTEGMIEGDLAGGRVVLIKGGTEEVLLETKNIKHVAEETGHFIQCIETGQRPITNGPDSLQGLRVIWRLYDAEEKGVVADLRGCGFK